jgi:hypothetical protein
MMSTEPQERPKGEATDRLGWVVTNALGLIVFLGTIALIVAVVLYETR